MDGTTPDTTATATAPAPGWWGRFMRVCRHRWHEPQARRLMTPALQQELSALIAQSETQHLGQVAIFVEGGLPGHYLWAGQTARERAIGLFGKLGVWDTEYNNGVLIYLLMAEHAIEIVADRGLRQRLDDAAWAEVVQHLQASLQAGQHAEGLRRAVEEATALLVAHFPREAGTADATGNEVPDAPRFR